MHLEEIAAEVSGMDASTSAHRVDVLRKVLGNMHEAHLRYAKDAPARASEMLAKARQIESLLARIEKFRQRHTACHHGRNKMAKAKAKTTAAPKAKARRGRKETPLEAAMKQIDAGEYDVAGIIREGPRAARSNAAKEEEAERMARNAAQRARHAFDEEYRQKQVARKTLAYHVKTVVDLLDANRPVVIKAAAVRLKLASPQKMARMTKKADVYGLFIDAVKNGTKAKEVREALAAVQEKRQPKRRADPADPKAKASASRGKPRPVARRRAA